MKAAASLLAISTVLLAGCGGGSGTIEPGTTRPSTAPARYRPGDPDCRARTVPGTIGSIGEGVVGAPARAFVACYGPPAVVLVHDGHRCLYYRERGTRTYWRLCTRGGAIVSALGDLRRPSGGGG
jgi:hypothetical protein